MDFMSCLTYLTVKPFGPFVEVALVRFNSTLPNFNDVWFTLYIVYTLPANLVVRGGLLKYKETVLVNDERY